MAILGLEVDARGTVAVLTWTTSLPARAEVAYGTHEPTLRASGPPWPATDHRVMLDRLAPGMTVRYQVAVTAATPSGDVATAEGAFRTPGDEVTLFLHTTRGPFGARERWMDPWDAEGDLDGTGYNGYGALLGTVQGLTGQPLPFYGEVADTYPVQPAHGALRLPAGSMAEATVFVKLVASGPTMLGMDTVLHEGAPGALLLRATLRAGGGAGGEPGEVVAVGQRLVSDVPGGDRFFPVAIPMPVLGGASGQDVIVTAGALALEVRANASATGYRFGFEGDHASRLRLPSPAGGAVPLGSGLAEPRVVMAGAQARFAAWALGGAGGHGFVWEVDGAPAGSGGPLLERTFGPGLAGEEHVVAVTVTDAAGEARRHEVVFRVHQRDHGEGPRVVVAVLDTGVNPYHRDFARPGIALPLGALGDATRGDRAPRVLALTQEEGPASGYAERVARDEAGWAGIGLRELVHFAGTNLLGVAVRDGDVLGHRLRDADGHGTAVASTVARTFPDAVVVMVQVTDGGGLRPALDWVLAQGWIDVVSISWGHLANLPFPPQDLDLAERTRALAAQGKVVVASAGNDPVPLFTDPVDGPPWVWSVAGSQAGGRAREAVSAFAYPDFAAASACRRRDTTARTGPRPVGTAPALRRPRPRGSRQGCCTRCGRRAGVRPGAAGRSRTRGCSHPASRRRACARR